MKITEKVVQTVLMNWAMYEKQHRCFAPNSMSIFRWEADLLSVTKAGLIHEFEVKLNRIDFMADFRNKKFKHDLLARHRHYKIPNYFWFVTHNIDTANIEVPDYAGLMVTERWGNKLCVGIKKSAPRLHGRHATQKQMAQFATALSHRLTHFYDKHHSRYLE